MKLGFTFDEKILDKIKFQDLIFKAKKTNISNIEISPDKNVLPIDTYVEISSYCKKLNIDVNFHIPYFAHDYLYEIMNFKEYKKDLIKKYEEFLCIVENIQNKTCNIPIIVIHGAKYINPEKFNEGMYNTLIFLDWILNFIEKKNISVKLALETLSKNTERTIGDIRKDVIEIIKKFKSNLLGICWDISHDSTNYYPGKVPFDDEFYKHIFYCHIHGVNIAKSISHISIQKSTIDFSKSINHLKQNKFEGIINLELLIKFCGKSYLDDLFNDINYLQNIL
ncbi:TIM barrel protein [Caminicella sporogenes]|uniref:TIM barrel protein n=1 Tax=Caminicella sporogenes TaxID=166485 RepID=UPI0025411015|nr:TIM barrel protein [Caminicella sporogenes]WIF94155.1 TIM barrel protein [Caminicella sporogenes]